MNEETVARINAYLKTQLWMDFEVCQLGAGKIELYGCLDELGPDKIVITFELPFLVDCALYFTYEGEGKDFISIPVGEEAYNINSTYGVIRGNKVFKISNTNMHRDMIIAASKISVKILDEDSPYFS